MSMFWHRSKLHSFALHFVPSTTMSNFAQNTTMNHFALRTTVSTRRVTMLLFMHKSIDGAFPFMILLGYHCIITWWQWKNILSGMSTSQKAIFNPMATEDWFPTEKPPKSSWYFRVWAALCIVTFACSCKITSTWQGGMSEWSSIHRKSTSPKVKHLFLPTSHPYSSRDYRKWTHHKAVIFSHWISVELWRMLRELPK